MASVMSSSLVESLRACSLSGLRVDKEDLKRRIRIPDYLRASIARAILTKDPGGSSAICSVNRDNKETPRTAPLSSSSTRVAVVGRGPSSRAGSSSSLGRSRP